MSEQRQYPRLNVRGETTVDIQGPRGKQTVAVTVTSLSCEGVSLRFHHPLTTPAKKLALHLAVDGNNLELPGQVAWQRENNEVGVRLMLAIAPARMRQQFAAWVVGLMRHQLPDAVSQT